MMSSINLNADSLNSPPAKISFMRFLFLFLITFVLFGCTKQRLDKFNNRIVGNWKLVEVNTFGIGNSNIVFDGGSFSFNEDNSLTYYDRTQNVYTGNWYIDAYTYTDDNGNSESEFILTLDVSNGKMRKYDEMEMPGFGNVNRFKAKVRHDLNTVTYVFERQ